MAFVLVVVAYAALTGVARADTSWTRISDMFGTNLVVPTLATDGPNAVVAWGRPVGPNQDRLEAVTFRPSLTAEVVSLSGPLNAAPVAQTVGYRPQLFARPGGLQLAFDGYVPSNPVGHALYVVPRNGDGTFGAAVQVGRPYSALGAALLLPDGTPLFASGHAGGALVLRGASDPDQDGTDFQAPLGGCCGYNPRLGIDGMGRLWLAWYSNATNNTGLYMQQVNPSTATPAGAAQKAPGSESPNNNTFHIAFACSVACRLVYGTGPITDQRLVSWAHGEGSATTIAKIPSATSAGRVVTASYRSDGRLWVAWHDGTNYRFTLGDAKGVGGEPLSAGHPPGAEGTAWGLNSLPVTEGLLLAANWNSGTAANQHAVWVNVVTVPPPVTKAPGPRDVELKAKGKQFVINVQYRLRTACSNPCPARAEIRTRTGKRIYASLTGSQLRGDGKIILGTRRGIRIPRGKKIFFSIAIKRAALLKTPFYTRGGFRFAETRLRVWLRTASGERLTIRDGRIKVSIARIKSGALPNLEGIL